VHAIVNTVAIDATRLDEAVSQLHDMVVPMAKSSAGFVNGYWLRSADTTKGLSVELYESQAAAEAAVQGRPEGPPPGSPVTLLTTDFMEVVASA
jgi:hypothetical protein